MNIQDAKIPTRAKISFKNYDINTLDDFLNKTPKEIARLPQMREKTIEQTIYGLTLSYLGYRWFGILANAILEQAKDTYGTNFYTD
jgi:hypothetical protein